MDYIVIWFVWLSLLDGSEPPGGYIPPQDVRATDMQCGIDGPVVGVSVDNVLNPTTAIFPDPNVASKHCTASIAARVAALPPGRYELATTEMGLAVPWPGQPPPYIGIDPHTSVEWVRSDVPLPIQRPGAARITP